jgi:hypothetical protein
MFQAVLCARQLFQKPLHSNFIFFQMQILDAQTFRTIRFANLLPTSKMKHAATIFAEMNLVQLKGKNQRLIITNLTKRSFSFAGLTVDHTMQRQGVNHSIHKRK